ncbi:MAG: NUDIX domain-containing protein [Chloroflexi bacterium]|nr:NUDIX domain-containing protein [Chloroflexota bacterium]MBM3154460.1 NUDIX domain-containing protein [Chloroflexota bacterium]MBM3172243.1 NUDIX domain-containing protein [Chloroflexota bacterium]MBM3174657.1 NUDIX domain-containing protein [Chloroflexota bacterium]MBM4450024.1 NUDIX domain-containing protein [Chloroflexota bacterium]
MGWHVGGEAIPARIVVAVGVVIEDDLGRVLLVKHKPERGGFWQGKWICPGGELEVGEEIGEGIRREIREETGLEVDLVKALPAFDRIVKRDGKVKLHVIYVDYEAKLVGGELKADSDVGEAKWVKKSSLGQIWEEIHEDTKKLLKLAGAV